MLLISQKILSVYANNTFEEKFEIIQKELINILKSPLDKIKNYVYIKQDESFIKLCLY